MPKKKPGPPKDWRTVARIEENRERFKDRKFPCPCCDRPRPVGIDKRGKPYIGCNDCGLQLFVRLPLGIDLMKRRVDGGGPARNTKSDDRRRERSRRGADLLRGGGT